MSTYATLAEFKSMSNKTASTSDAAIQLCLDAAEAAIDAHCNRGGSFITGATATARLLVSRGGTLLLIPDCTSVTTVQTRASVSSAWETLTADEWVAFNGDTTQPDFSTTPYAALMLTETGRVAWPVQPRRDAALPLVQVTARWGYANSSPPPQVKTATLAQATRWFKRFESSFADAAANGDMGSILFRSALDPDIKMMLDVARLVRPTV